MNVSKRLWALLLPIGGLVLGFLIPMVAAGIFVARAGQPDAAGAFSFPGIVTVPLGVKSGLFLRRIVNASGRD